MGVRKLAHYAIRTDDLESSRRFYKEVLHFREGFRPPFPFPGAWLYLGEDEADYGVVHLIGLDAEAEGLKAYLGDRPDPRGTGVVDHIAFLADGWAELRTRCRRLGVEYSERRVPLLRLHQVFIADPSGVVVELNFPADEAQA